MNVTSTETTPSAVSGVAKNEHTTLLIWILPELYLLFLHNPAAFFPTHPWQSNHCSTSAQTRQHDRLTFHSLPIPPHATTPHTPLLGQTSTSPGPRLSPRPTNLTLKTLSKQSLPIQTTIFNATNVANLDVCTSFPPPTTPFIHGDEVIGKLYQKKHGPYPFHHWPLGTIWSSATGIPHHHPPSPPKPLMHHSHQLHISPTQCQPHVRTRLPTTVIVWPLFVDNSHILIPALF